MAKQVDEKLVWHNEQIRVGDCKGYKYNPRSLTNNERKELKKSLEKFNLVEIPALDLDDTIIAGHQRIEVLMMLGRVDEIIDVRKPNRKLTKEEFDEYNLRSNKTTGEWDLEKLMAHFDKDLVASIGFSEEEMSKGLNQSSEDMESLMSARQEEKLVPYTKIHVLISFEPDIFLKIADMLKNIKDTKGVEYEQSAN
jgi:hypothetical protein